MAKIFSPPSEVGEKPPFDYRNVEASLMQEEQWVQSIKTWIKSHSPSKDPIIGEEISFPVADNYARYIVYGLKPLALIHLPTGDAYQFQYANRLTVSDVREKVRSGQAMRKLFANAH